MGSKSWRSLIEIPITNAFSNVPEGLVPAQFAERLARKTRWAYGAPLHWFLDLVATQVTTSAKEAAFRQRIKTEIAAMRTRVRIPQSDGATNRVASYFALIEIAGGMAADDGILPVSRRAVRDAVEHVWTAYKSSLSGAVPVSAIEGLRNYIKVHRHEFADARVKQAQRRRLACRRPRICHRNGQVGGILFLRRTVQSALPTRLHRETALRLSTA